MRNQETETVEDLQNVLFRHGFSRCDIPACNCGSWHQRFGLPERFREIEDMLEEAGFPLCNANGHLVSRALADLIRGYELLVTNRNTHHAS
jgi:phosphoribosylformylglycinamidine (FGAM) synthase-like amidotransferase family enzyme